MEYISLETIVDLLNDAIESQDMSMVVSAREKLILIIETQDAETYFGQDDD